MLPFAIHLNAATGSAVCNRTAAESTSAVNGLGPVAPAPPAVARAAPVKARMQKLLRSPNTIQF
jgi:hypothetical protein